jgi:hypothetical protein
VEGAASPVQSTYGAAMTGLGELKIPKGLRPVADEIGAITDRICSAILDEEYADLARRAVAKLARKRPSPLSGGRRATWAAGVLYALGQVNFLFDPASEPYATAEQLSQAAGVAKSTMSGKAKHVRDLLRIGHFSPEFQRADVAERNPLVWMIEVNGFVVDARRVPLEIQIEAFQRGLIPHVPALGSENIPAGRAPAVGSLLAPEAADVLEHCSELKRQLVEFARSPRFSRQLDRALGEGQADEVADGTGFINITDHFILQRPLHDGRTVVETFVLEHPELADTDRQTLLGWRDVVEGVFEIREWDGDAIIAANLIDELTYRIYSNAGSDRLAAIQPGCFMTARIVPIGDDWLLSGAQQTLPASGRAAMLVAAARMAAEHPQLVFRNPDKVAQGWELARRQRARFIEHFGSDLVIVPGPEVGSRMNGFLAWQARQAAGGPRTAATPDPDTAALTPQFQVPGDLATAPTVALICDETEGLAFLANFRLVQEAFENPELAADREHARAVLGYLSEDSISAMPFHRLAGADTGQASQLFRRLLNEPEFSWERDGESLLRKHKPRCFGAKPLPPVTPLRSELANALHPSS